MSKGTEADRETPRALRGRRLAAAVVRWAVAVLIVAGGLTAGPGVAGAAAQAPGADGAFTIDQAADGWSVYGVQCGQCHGVNLEGMVHAPPLSGVGFLNSWLGQTTDDMFAYLRDEMPPGQAGVISDQAYIDLVAYLLEANGAVPGDRTLTVDAGVPIGDAADMEEARRAAGAGERPRRRSSRFVNQVVPHELSPVTDEMLADPPPGDWLNWRRTRNSHGYSTLDQVTRDNVADLKLEWSISVRPGNHQTTPLVHDGVMFLAHPGNVVQALDAATGDVIWVYRHRLPDDARAGATRTLALYE
ncbi:MAG: c-type cytochrome, partial [Acidobacteria bacterium]|nr:c-type cytochrome [Acidobacteriota bacterium]